MTEYILYVDDELLIKRLISSHFRHKIRAKEYEFIFAHNGIEALDKLKEYPQIDMVVTDINMPEMDGLTLLKKLREINQNIKAVVVSAYGDGKTIQKAMDLGAYDFINKPINLQELESTISRTLHYVQQLKSGNVR